MNCVVEYGKHRGLTSQSLSSHKDSLHKRNLGTSPKTPTIFFFFQVTQHSHALP
ncbi:hypothetical protein NEUTE1DRAFT_118663 [Neurospora tetrasperma FGSC 2508]|uniref:Uncharacterized protein n=1 Tax=Neurospora tetrasperma (strain FGSC 2508 / ATCC MYA-4615 / P0657) TaxID=510951 RepID=F8N0P0_NEUT8|nr:uncharacterized protein NEUTE1DRAFT_118663 [Neurospora tetrasperma FGSC 2508]EGO52180.1 hypothetical protein NEUTE1DRAFT_118663 [Neurospora tetrasperma FGSC 2508]